ncbi:hypothetical protein PAPYR_5281 [Paratrimastix pyriformis]|uniref:Uncharacterized protein n=1 Tax=Paratrimastix pyriformis TaxID=342808 RepID=A0ABQ8UHT9_9EUKA|nr:hypothetical protein PAPYR_5281 [Paratrimastix pyriformis]
MKRQLWPSVTEVLREKLSSKRDELPSDEDKLLCQYYGTSDWFAGTGAARPARGPLAGYSGYAFSKEEAIFTPKPSSRPVSPDLIVRTLDR